MEEIAMEAPQGPKKARDSSLPTPEKKPYAKPVLQDYGDIRDLTLGSTMGNLESGGGGITFRY
jgi:hypothetical protein